MTSPRWQAEWEAKLREAHVHPGGDVEWDFALTEFRAGYDYWRKIINSDAAHRSKRLQDCFVDYFVIRGQSPISTKTRPPRISLRKCRKSWRRSKVHCRRSRKRPSWRTMANPPEQHIATGGDFRVPGAKVEPGTLAVLRALETGNLPPRLALARWIASRDNPLTARVAVNRIWQEFFGRGIVRTSDDFGAQGEKPSHPELLDWLAAEFVDRGWSMKHMHRLIVTSATYRQSSKHARISKRRSRQRFARAPVARAPARGADSRCGVVRQRPAEPGHRRAERKAAAAAGRRRAELCEAA